MFNRVSGRRLGVLGVPFSLLVAASVLGCSSNNRDGGAVASPTPSPTPMPSVSPTPTPTPTASPSPSPTVTPSPTPPPVAVVYGVRDGTRLVRFSPDAPGTVEVLGSIPNLNSGESLIGIDVRPSDNALLATTSEGRLFKLENLQPDLITVRILQPITQAGVQLSATARDFGVDVNPFVPGTAPAVAGALRIISDDGQNLRVPPSALVDPPPGATQPVFTDGQIGYRLLASPAANNAVVAASFVTSNADSSNLFTLARSPGFGLFESFGAFAVDTAASAAVNLRGGVGTLVSTASLTVATPTEAWAVINRAAIVGEVRLGGQVIIEGDPTAGLYPINPATGAAGAEAARLLTGEDSSNYFRGLIIRDEASGRRSFLTVRGRGAQTAVLHIDEECRDLPTPPMMPDDCDVAGNRSPIDGLNGSEVIGMTERILANGGREYWLLSSTGELFRLASTTFTPGTMAANRVGAQRRGQIANFNEADAGFAYNRQTQRFLVMLRDGRLLEVTDVLTGDTVERRPLRVVGPAGTLPGGANPQVVATAYLDSGTPPAGIQVVLDRRGSCIRGVLVPNDGLIERECTSIFGSVAGLALDPMQPQSLDIGPSPAQDALAALNLEGENRTRLFRVDLNTRTATSLGFIGDLPDGRIGSIAIRLE
jgi:hypothetical protein